MSILIALNTISMDFLVALITHTMDLFVALKREIFDLWTFHRPKFWNHWVYMNILTKCKPIVREKKLFHGTFKVVDLNYE